MVSLFTYGGSFLRMPVPWDTLFRTCWICGFHVRPLSRMTARNFVSITSSICWPLNSICNVLSIIGWFLSQTGGNKEMLSMSWVHHVLVQHLRTPSHTAGTFTAAGYVGWHKTIALVCNYELFILVIDVIFVGIFYKHIIKRGAYTIV